MTTPAREAAERIVAEHIRGRRPLESHAEMVDDIVAAILAENEACAEMMARGERDTSVQFDRTRHASLSKWTAERRAAAIRSRHQEPLAKPLPARPEESA